MHDEARKFIMLTGQSLFHYEVLMSLKLLKR